MSFARLSASALSQRLGRRLARPLCRVGALAAALVVAACGGNATRVEPFVPTSLVVFGDENSLISTSISGASAGNGLTYSVNFYDTANARVSCATSPVWSHYVAQNFGLVFAECNPAPSVATPNAFMRAAAGDRVAQVESKVAAYRASPGFTSKTLVTVMAGMWDIQDAYVAVKDGTKSRDQALVDIRALGVRLGNLVNQITNNGNGGRVLYSTVPNIGLGPCTAISNPNIGTGITTCTHRATLLLDLTAEFNKSLRLAVTNDGYYAGLVTADTTVAAMSDLRNTGYGLINTSSAACVSNPPPACLSNNVVAGALVNNIYTYLWADALNLTPPAHAQIGLLAVTRARNNPF